MKRLLMPILLMYATILAQSDNDMTTVLSCQLTVKTTAYPPDSADLSGKAMVEATLLDNEGFPIYNQEVQMTTTTGVFSCLPPEVITEATMKDPVLYCFTTGQDGKIQAYIVNIPFNKQGRLDASSTCGTSVVKASGKFLITRSVLKKKHKKKLLPPGY